MASTPKRPGRRPARRSLEIHVAPSPTSDRVRVIRQAVEGGTYADLGVDVAPTGGGEWSVTVSGAVRSEAELAGLAWGCILDYATDLFRAARAQEHADRIRA